MQTLVQLRTDVVAKGGSTTLRHVNDFVDVEWREALAGDRGGCKLLLPAESLAIADAAIGNVIRVSDVYLGYEFTGIPLSQFSVTREYRINDLQDGPMRSTVQVTAQPVVTDLGRVLVSQVVGGVRQYDVAVSFLTPAQIVDAFLIPALTAAGITWVVKGTVGGDPLSLAWQRQTVLGLCLLLEEATGLEFGFDRSYTDANYAINLTARVIDTIDTRPVAFVGRNVVALERQITADQRFYTRAVPQGQVAPDEIEPSHIGQATTLIQGVSGNTLTIDNPYSDDPIAFDDQLNGLTGMITLDAPPFGLGADGVSRGVAYDHTRHRLVVSSQLTAFAGHFLFWHDLDDGTSGSVGGFSSDQRGVAYVGGTVDKFYLANASTGNIKAINASDFSVAATITITGGARPTRVEYHPHWDRVTVTHAAGIDVINPNTNTVVGTLSTATRNHFVLYDAVSARVLTFGGGTTGGEIYNGSTLAFIANWACPSNTTLRTAGRIDENGGDASTIYAIGDDTVALTPVGFTITPSTNVTSAKTTLPVAAQPYSGSRMEFSRLAAAFMAFSADTLFLFSKTWAQIASVPIAFSDTLVDGWTFDSYARGDTNYLFLPDALGRHTRILQAPHFASYQKFTVSDSTAPFTVVKAAGSVGLYNNDQRVEFRANAALDYRTQMDDPASIATYGQIEGVAPFDVIGKRNYLRAGAQYEWRSDGVPKYLSVVDDAPASPGEYRWSASLQQAVNPATAAVSSTYGSGNDTIVIKNLPANQQLQPGDVISRNNTTPFGPGQYVFVRAKVTANGSGVATVAISANGFPTGLAVDVPLYVYVPDVKATSPGGLPTGDLLVMWPKTANSGLFPTVYGQASVPYLVSASVCWAVVRLLVRCVNGSPGVLALAAAAKGADFDDNEVAIDDAQSYSDGVIREYVLAQRVELTGGSSVAIRLRATTTTNGLVVYVKSLAVFNAFGPITDRDIPFSDASLLWAAGNRALKIHNTPAVSYRVEAVEDDTTLTKLTEGRGLFLLGRTITLRDPARGISAAPRIIEITRHAVNGGQVWRQPILTLDNRPTSLVESLVAIE